MWRGRLITTLLLVSCTSTFAQRSSNLTQYLNLYPDDNAIFLSRKEHATIRIESGQLKIFSDKSEDMLLLNEKANIFNEKSIYYSTFEEISNIQAMTRVPSGKGYKDVKVENIITKTDMSAGTFYDDYKAKTYVYPDLQAGARLVLSYRETLKEPRFFGNFFFGAYIPSEYSEFSVTFPPEVKIKYKLYGCEDGDVMFTKTESKKGNTYTWSANFPKKHRSETDAPNVRYYAPHLIVYIDEYTINGKTQKLLSDVGELYKWYRELVKDVNKNNDEHLKTLVDSITSGARTETEKVKRIYYWVQDNIKYIAFEDGLGGFVPREASAICDKRYGDCKDMSSILSKMLTLADVKNARIAWIGTRHIPYTYEDVPSPLCDNHMIATWNDNGNYYFLDATGKNTPLGMYTSMIQGKEALIYKGESGYDIVKVPEVPKEKNVSSDTVFIHMNNDRIAGTGLYDVTGFQKIDLCYNMQGLSEDEKLKFLRKFLQKGSNKFQLDSISCSNLQEKENDLKIRYNFSISDYARLNGNETYCNMNLDKSLFNDYLKPEDRKIDREIDYKSIDKNTTVMEIPDGYAADYIPKNASYSSPKFGFDMKYTLRGNKIYCDKSVYIDALLIKTTDFPEWNKMISALSSAYKETVILKKK